MEQVFVINELRQDPISGIEKNIEVIKLLSYGKMEKISLVIEDMNIEGGDTLFTIANIYHPSIRSYCKKMESADFIESDNLDKKIRFYVIHCSKGQLADVISRIMNNPFSILALLTIKIEAPVVSKERGIENETPLDEKKDVKLVEETKALGKERVKSAIVKGKVAILAAGLMLLIGVLFIGITIIKWR